MDGTVNLMPIRDSIVCKDTSQVNGTLKDAEPLLNRFNVVTDLEASVQDLDHLQAGETKAADTLSVVVHAVCLIV